MLIYIYKKMYIYIYIYMVYIWAAAIQYVSFVRAVMSVYIILKIKCKLQNMLIAYAISETVAE